MREREREREGLVKNGEEGDEEGRKRILELLGVYQNDVVLIVQNDVVLLSEEFGFSRRGR